MLTIFRIISPAIGLIAGPSPFWAPFAHTALRSLASRPSSDFGGLTRTRPPGCCRARHPPSRSRPLLSCGRHAHPACPETCPGAPSRAQAVAPRPPLVGKRQGLWHPELCMYFHRTVLSPLPSARWKLQTLTRRRRRALAQLSSVITRGRSAVGSRQMCPYTVRCMVCSSHDCIDNACRYRYMHPRLLG